MGLTISWTWPGRQMSAVETRQMSAVETRQMSAVETGQMSAAETGQMSAVETRQMSTIETGLCPASILYIYLVSTADICLVSTEESPSPILVDQSSGPVQKHQIWFEMD